VVPEDSIAGDMVFVSDLYTTFARIAGNMEGIPRDRVVDGIDQTALVLKGDTAGRRDYVHLYEVDQLKATVKQNMKIHWSAPGVNPAMAGIYNLYWDPREDNPLKYQGVCQPWDRASLGLGYRVYSIDYSDGDGADEFGWDATLHGPYFTFVYQF
jgi:arylsulfatase